MRQYNYPARHRTQGSGKELEFEAGYIRYLANWAVEGVTTKTLYKTSAPYLLKLIKVAQLAIT
jgi:hypothetical protein